jgi:hypothetical protein
MSSWTKISSRISDPFLCCALGGPIVSFGSLVYVRFAGCFVPTCAMMATSCAAGSAPHPTHPNWKDNPQLTEGKGEKENRTRKFSSRPSAERDPP